MRKLLTIILLFISLTIQGTTYYLDPAGVNSAGRDGSIGQPWLTLSYAVTRVAADAGHLIHFNAGTYYMPAKVIVPTGISIEGAGVASLITTDYAGAGAERDATISFGENDAEGTNGNQSIHNLAFNGLGTTQTPAGKSAIAVRARSNVAVYNCTFTNFLHSAAIFYGGSSSWATDVGKTYAEGNSYHHNTSNNCSKTVFGDKQNNTGHVWMQGQKDLLIYNNTMTQTSRTAGYNGMCIKGVEGFFKGVKIYDNYLYQNTTSAEIGFSMELWYVRGGCEIYNNTIDLCVDIARGIIKSTYPFSIKVYDNTIGQTEYPAGSSPSGVLLERDVQDVYIYNNLIKNVKYGVDISSAITSTFERIYVYYNLIQDISNYGDAINLWYSEPGQTVTYTDFHIYNNVLYCKVGGTAWSGVSLPTYGIVTNFYIKNNIIMNAVSTPIRGEQPACVVNNLVITNNIFWACGNANEVKLTTNYKSNNYTGPPTVPQIKSDPLFMSPVTNFHLYDNTPAKNTGVHLPFSFITMDYDSVSIASVPEIGAYELTGYTPSVVPTVTTNEITDIGLTTATGGGNVVDDGGEAVTARGVCWDITTAPTTADSKTTNGTGLGTFVSSLTGLTQSTPYFVRSYATNSVGTAYGNEVTFETGPPAEPEVGTGTITRTSDSTATGSGNVISQGSGGGTVTSRGVCWSISADPTKADNSASAVAGGLGEYTALMTGLTTTIYYVRAWATNQTTTSYGDNVVLNMVKAPLLRGVGDTLIRGTDLKLIRVR